MGFEGTIQEMAEQLITDFEAERCTIRVLRGKKLRLMVARGINEEIRREEISIAGTIAGDALTTGEIQDIPDITKDSRYDPMYIVHNGARSLMAIPLTFKDMRLGVAQIYRKEPFSNKDKNFAKTVAGYMAFTLYHIEISKMNRQAIQDIIESIIDCTSVEKALMKIVEKVSQRLGVSSCLIYQISGQEEVMMCRIVAGVPPGVHEIDRKESLEKQPHLANALKKKEIVTFDEDQLYHSDLTEHLMDIIKRRQIKGLLLAPVALDGIIVLEATGDRENFSAEEKSFCLDVSKIAATLFQRDRNRMKEIEDQVLNPTESMAGLATRNFESVLQIRENVSGVCIHQKDKCAVAASMCDCAESLLPNTVRISTEGKKVASSLHRIRNLHT